MFLLNTCNIQPLECSPCSPTKKKHVHPGKLTCPLTKGTISIGNTSSNHQFSRDMLVFRGVFVQNDNLLLKAKLTIKGCDRHRSAKGYLGVPTHNCDRETSPFLIVKCFYKNPFFLQGKKGPEYTRLLVQLKSYLRRASFIIHHLSSLPKICSFSTFSTVKFQDQQLHRRPEFSTEGPKKVGRKMDVVWFLY